MEDRGGLRIYSESNWALKMRHDRKVLPKGLYTVKKFRHRYIGLIIRWHVSRFYM